MAGTIDIESEKPHAFDDGVQALLEACADANPALVAAVISIRLSE